jgi:hypothetical protein
MGWETANVHLGSKRTRTILKDLTARPQHWLHESAARMVKATTADWNEWRSKAAPGKTKSAGK